MKRLVLLVAAILLVSDTCEGKKRKKFPKHEIDEEIEQLALDDITNEIIDPCAKKHCGAGQVCRLDELGEPFCKCIEECPKEVEPRRKVCSNHNVTWGSDCELYRMRCWCKRDMDTCDGSESEKETYKHMHIEYYGECREMEECTEGQMLDFPRRMRDWLFNIMRDMAERDELSPHYLKMEREAETNMTKRWANAAVWKFCDLDSSQDRFVSRHELFPIRAPLMALEHCIAPFLNNCDADNDHKITLPEWAKCMEIDEDAIEERCEEIRQNDELDQ